MNTPLFHALKKHALKHPVSFHVPGHKYGNTFNREGYSFYKELLKLDATEITGLDDLHDPGGPILEAMELAADFYGVRKTYFLVNGTTAGNLAMILAAVKENEVVLVQRNSHKSILHALELAGAWPVFLSPDYDDGLQAAASVTESVIAEALELYPEAKALVLTSPNYYGAAADLSGIVKMAHAKNIPVLVDEAHGAHFTLGAPFPTSALEAGADIAVHSAHKTLPAMTMGSYLHFNSRLVDEERMAYYLNVLQSSSPSYPIMASLDLARAYLQEIKEAGRLPGILAAVHQTREDLARLPGLSLMKPALPNLKADPLKAAVKSVRGLSGFRVQEIFEDSGFYGELAEQGHFLLVLPLDEWNPFDERYGILWENLSQEKGSGKEADPLAPSVSGDAISPLPVSYAGLKKRKVKVLPFHMAAGRLSAEAVVPYPPGIPLLARGEVVNPDHLRQAERLMEHGTQLQGGRHLAEKRLAVYE
ncbi:aminotransferase class I/II-fold pyridoxal phosphate-dependent enzyme [Metabacillus sp. GX 13764]|uniref:aminotransferase class I/II-fold pyridoxal phosphate-dependent enzyme n=1 Tax=Metabacillus kandeliae TaxID=2900151 RepID=UPI001E4D054C|nr:aminotransferase class I/II-fold pyridoxal phosphate-dependent enzyme [Metabacillus kandeliae]MCD7036622.1 aminotransferase class I/II-fold pyridoxal phosphate-dependent enzyme [Metabacillus kandeliae]